MEAGFKVTSAFGDQLARQLEVQDAPKEDWAGLPTYRPSPDGLPHRTDEIKYEIDDTSWGSTKSATYAIKVGDARIEFVRAHNSTATKANALHNTVRITMSADSTPEQFGEVLDGLGIPSTPASEGDLRVYAENAILATFGTDTDPTKNLSADKRQAKLADIKDTWGVSPETMVMTPDAHGRNKFLLTDEVRDKLIEALDVGGFRHSISFDKLDLDGWMSLLDGPNPGLIATRARWNEGVLTRGLSSPADMNSGGADYVFTKVRHGGIDEVPERGVYAFIDARAAMRRTDVYVNQIDDGGARGQDRDIYNLLEGSPYETMFKDSIPLSDIRYIVIGEDDGLITRKEIIDALKSRGTTLINGIPIEDYLLENGQVAPQYDPATWNTPLERVLEDV